MTMGLDIALSITTDLPLLNFMLGMAVTLLAVILLFLRLLRQFLDFGLLFLNMWQLLI